MGEHVLIRQPAKKSKEGNILLPDQFQKDYSYGKVVSVGGLARALCHVDVGAEGNQLDDGDIVAFDFQGARQLELDPTKDADLVVVHASQIYCRLHPKQLEARKLPVP